MADKEHPCLCLASAETYRELRRNRPSGPRSFTLDLSNDLSSKVAFGTELSQALGLPVRESYNWDALRDVASDALDALGHDDIAIFWPDARPERWAVGRDYYVAIDVLHDICADLVRESKGTKTGLAVVETSIAFEDIDLAASSSDPRLRN